MQSASQQAGKPSASIKAYHSCYSSRNMLSGTKPLFFTGFSLAIFFAGITGWQALRLVFSYGSSILNPNKEIKIFSKFLLIAEKIPY